MMASESSFKTYLFSYQHEGANWVLELKAESAEDAQRRISRLQYAHYDGELIAKIAVKPAFRGLLSSFLTILINLIPSSKR